MQAYFKLLEESIQNKTILQLTYANAGGAYSERTIEPQALYLTSHSAWRLVAWCHLRADYREFNLDRIQNLKKTEEIAAPRFFQLAHYFLEK